MNMKNYRTEGDKKNRGLLKQLAAASQMGVNLVAATFVGLGIGYGLDKLFKTSPWFTVIFLFIGVIAGFVELYRFAMKQGDNEDKKGL